MKNNLFIGCAFFITACNQAKTAVTDPASAEKYITLHDNLYTDDAGNLYHRTRDVSNDGKSAYAYSNYLWADTLINGEQISETYDLKDIIDEATFHKSSDTDTTDRIEYYQDKNRSYFIQLNADGGTLQAR